MKIKPMPFILSIFISLAILFSGWFMYEHYFIQQPIRQIVEAESTIEHYELTVSPREITVLIDVNPQFSLKTDYTNVLQSIKQAVPKNNVSLIIKDSPTESLLDTWNTLHFLFAEGIMNKNYYDMLTRLNDVDIDPSIDIDVAMDRENVYVWLHDTDEGKSLFHVLPLDDKREEYVNG